MLPSIDSPLAFGLALGPTMFLAVIWHELGHVLAARAAGIEVIAWGVGYRDPWFFRRFGSSTLYLGRPFTGGMTIGYFPLLERQPIKQLVVVLGGPLASVVGVILGLVAFHLGMRSVLITAWIYVSLIFVLLSTIPFIIRSRQLCLPNDAHQLIQILIQGREHFPTPLGPLLASLQATAKLLIEIDSQFGASYLRSSIAIVQSLLSDTISARASLTEVAAGPTPCALYFYAHAVAAAVENADDAELAIEAARTQYQGDATAQFSIDCVQEQWRLARGLGDANSREILRRRALAASRRDWQCWIEELMFLADAFQDVESRCRELLRTNDRYLNDAAKARLRAVAAARLASQGAAEEAQRLCDESMAAIAKIANSIACEETRKAYIQAAIAPLQPFRAEDLTAEICNFAANAEPEQATRRRIFAFAALALGLPAFAGSAVSACLIYTEVFASDASISVLLQGLAVLASMTSLLAGMISILRSERDRWRVLTPALTLAFLVMAIAGISLSKP